jgi:hypothetical protein
MNWKVTVRPKTSEICAGASMTLKKGCQPRTNIVKDEKGGLVIDCDRILGRWRKLPLSY